MDCVKLLLFLCARILTFPLMILKKAAGNPIFPAVRASRISWSTINVRMSPLFCDCVALCYAPKGPVHPISASLYSGCSLAFAFPIFYCRQTVVFGMRHALSQPSCLALVTNRVSLSRSVYYLWPVLHVCPAQSFPSHRCLLLRCPVV
jgi:hypothetical protein